MNNDNLEQIKRTVISKMTAYLLSFKKLLKDSNYHCIGSDIIPWSHLKLGYEFQEKYLAVYKDPISTFIGKKNLIGRASSSSAHDLLCLCLLTSADDVKKEYNKYSEIQVDIHLDSCKISMMVNYGKVANNLYPYKVCYDVDLSTKELTAHHYAIPQRHNGLNDDTWYFDSNNPNGLGSLDLAILILGNADLIASEISSALKRKEQYYKQCMAKKKANEDALANRYAQLLNAI